MHLHVQTLSASLNSCNHCVDLALEEKQGCEEEGKRKKGGSRKESSKPFRNGGGAGEGSSYEYAFICSRKELYCNQDAEKCLLLTGPSEKRLSSLEWSL